MTAKELPPARILGIESSCDETAAAVVENGHTIMSNVVASQAELHAKYGGVFPEVASREHIRTIYTIVEEALVQAHLALADIDAIAVTRGPGLPGSLVVGLNMAKGLSLGSGKPLVGVNHLEGHLYSAWIDEGEQEGDQTERRRPGIGHRGQAYLRARRRGRHGLCRGHWGAGGVPFHPWHP